MATIADVQDLLRNLRSVTKVEGVNDGFLVEIKSVNYLLLESDVDDYLSIRDRLTLQPVTSIFVSGYYEHSVDLLGPGFAGRTRLFSGNEDRIQLLSQDGVLQSELSGVSTRYLLSMLDKLDRRQFPQYLVRGGTWLAERYQASESQPRLSDAVPRVLTIKVSAAEQFRERSKPDTLRSIAEASLFNISYARAIGMSLSRSWERNSSRSGPQRDCDIQFPKRTYEADLLAYYHLGLSSESLILGYISLYKILEYFYLSTAEAVLHKRLKDKLAAPDFNHRQASQLRSLVSTVKKFDQKTDEQRMLTNVLEQFFMPDEIVSWVEQFESENGKYYTVPQSVFGLSTTFDANTDKVAPSLAQRIYHIRNALVHNKEGELARFIPFAGQENVLEKELPIVLFLAEQLIIKTGKDL